MRACSVSEQNSHIPLDRRTFLQWLSQWWRGQHEFRVSEFQYKSYRHRLPRPGSPRSHRLRHVAQLELLDFAGRGPRQFGEHDVARTFVAGEVLAAPGDDIVPRRLLSRLELDEGARRLTPFVVGLGHHGGGPNRGVLVERILYLDRGNVLAAGDDEVLGAILELDIAVAMHDAEVAGMKPAAGKRLLGRRLVFEVTF